MVARVQQLVCVDPSLIFASGFSNGNFFSYRLACEASDLVRACGPVREESQSAQSRHSSSYHAGAPPRRRCGPCTVPRHWRQRWRTLGRGNVLVPQPDTLHPADRKRTDDGSPPLSCTAQSLLTRWASGAPCPPPRCGGGGVDSTSMAPRILSSFSTAAARALSGTSRPRSPTASMRPRCRRGAHAGTLPTDEGLTESGCGRTVDGRAWVAQVTFRNGSVTCETWNQCNGGIEATFCTIEGQGHEWPGARRARGRPSQPATTHVRWLPPPGWDRSCARRLLQRLRRRDAGHQRYARDVGVFQARRGPRLKRSVYVGVCKGASSVRPPSCGFPLP